jgi:hypothetical protein
MKNEHTRRRERAEAAHLRAISPAKFWREFGIQRAITALATQKLFEVREIALGETQRMVTCATAGEAIVLAKQWRDEWGSRTVALSPDGEVIAEHAAGEPR